MINSGLIINLSSNITTGILFTNIFPSNSKYTDNNALPYFNGTVHGLSVNPGTGMVMFNPFLGTSTISK